MRSGENSNTFPSLLLLPLMQSIQSRTCKHTRHAKHDLFNKNNHKCGWLSLAVYQSFCNQEMPLLSWHNYAGRLLLLLEHNFLPFTSKKRATDTKDLFQCQRMEESTAQSLHSVVELFKGRNSIITYCTRSFKGVSYHIQHLCCCGIPSTLCMSYNVFLEINVQVHLESHG